MEFKSIQRSSATTPSSRYSKQHDNAKFNSRPPNSTILVPRYKEDAPLNLRLQTRNIKNITLIGNVIVILLNFKFVSVVNLLQVVLSSS